uniref:Secreted protein n=1 Tax=Macrostomum lignano TaxID=282301 RepID=A0A1I8FMU1_9PLAT
QATGREFLPPGQHPGPVPGPAQPRTEWFELADASTLVLAPPVRHGLLPLLPAGRLPSAAGPWPEMVPASTTGCRPVGGHRQVSTPSRPSACSPPTLLRRLAKLARPGRLPAVAGGLRQARAPLGTEAVLPRAGRRPAPGLHNATRRLRLPSRPPPDFNSGRHVRPRRHRRRFQL